MESEKCYVFGEHNARPAKRRRVEPQNLTASLALRKRAYRAHWSRQEELLNETIRNANVEVLQRLSAFVSTETSSRSVSHLPTALILTNPGALTHGTLTSEIRDSVTTEAGSVAVTLTPAEATNLKTCLKNLINKTTQQPPSSNDDAEEVYDQLSNRKLLNYDPEILHQWCRAHSVQKVVILIQDAETFDTATFADFLDVLHSWLDRINFVLLCGLATSVDIFQDKLPSAALRRMKGDVFDMSNSETLLEDAFAASIWDRRTMLRLGPASTDLILQRQNDCGQSIEMYSESLKYAYMSHFYGNALSIFLSEDVEFEDLNKAHFEALRNLPSFRTHCESVLVNEPTYVRGLLEDDRKLFSQVKEHLLQSLQKIQWRIRAVSVMRLLIRRGVTDVPPFSELYCKALSGDLEQSPILREVLLSAKKYTSDVLVEISRDMGELLDTPPTHIHDTAASLSKIQEELAQLIKDGDTSLKTPMKSEHDIRQSTFRTTVVAQKVSLSKQKSQISAQDSAYTSLLLRFHDLLKDYFHNAFGQPYNQVFLSEIIFYDLKAPYRDSFMPRPRYAIERALATPHDYLGCNCCAATDEGLVPTQPPTALLYQLYLESGALINAFDLWSAFKAVIIERVGEEEMAMALFFRSLAELRHLGMVKHSRKKLDHIAKLAWKGL